MGKFILSFNDGRYRFSFKTSGGERIATSTPYITKTSAQQAINQTRKFSTCQQCYLKGQEEQGYYFVLLDDDRRELIRSDKFSTAAKRDDAINILQHEAELAHFADTI